MKRKTSQRAAIEQVFCQLDRPLGIEEILETGRMAVESLNQATVYRNVKLLLENGWLKQVCHPSLGTLYEAIAGDRTITGEIFRANGPDEPVNVDLIDTDDKGYDFGKPILIEEVKLKFEREQTE